MAIACCFLIGQVVSYVISTIAEWIISMDLVIFLLTFSAEFMEINFNEPTLKTVSPRQSHAATSPA